MKFYLVLWHTDVKGNSCGQQITHRESGVGRGYSGVGGNGHDACCHCLVIKRETYKTREEADAKAKELQAQNPNDFFFSLEVKSPK